MMIKFMISACYGDISKILKRHCLNFCSYAGSKKARNYMLQSDDIGVNKLER